MDRLKSIETFVVAAKAKSFADAAARLRITRALVGRRIAQLEEHLKVRLFNRTTRELSLTPEGRKYLNTCEGVIEQLLEAEESLLGSSSALVGEFKILAAGSFGRSQLIPAIAAFVKTYPDLKIELELASTSLTAIQLVERGFDLGIRIYPPPPTSRFIMKKICNFDWILCASADYMGSREPMRQLKDLARHSLIVARSHEKWKLTRRGRASIVTPDPYVKVSSEAVRPAVLAGLGIGLQPLYLVAEDIRSGRIVPVLNQYSDPTGRIYAVYPHAKRQSAKVRLFTDFLAKSTDRRFELSALATYTARRSTSRRAAI
jgi:DNA-binding transcriptional LysR family regulator